MVDKIVLGIMMCTRAATAAMGGVVFGSLANDYSPTVMCAVAGAGGAFALFALLFFSYSPHIWGDDKR